MVISEYTRNHFAARYGIDSDTAMRVARAEGIADRSRFADPQLLSSNVTNEVSFTDAAGISESAHLAMADDSDHGDIRPGEWAEVMQGIYERAFMGDDSR